MPAGAGGTGGAGGQGGSGGDGGSGGSGGVGGAGGGAFQIIADGRINAAGSFTAYGGAGQSGTGGQSGTPGFMGTSGFLGQAGGPGAVFGVISGGNGGNGGAGGAGGTGGAGAVGGLGGTGGGGAGGTVELVGSVLSAPGATVDAAGGEGGNVGANGRLLLGSNTAGGGPIAPIAADVENFTGTRGTNPFIAGGSTLTPYIPDLVGGAERFGQLTLGSGASDFAGVIAHEPSNAVGALLRLAVGPTGYADAFTGYDMLLFLNLSDHALLDPELGIVPTGAGAQFEHALLTEGYLNDPTFGGGGPLTLGSLGVGDVFATLVPTDNFILNALVSGAGPIDDASLATVACCT